MMKQLLHRSFALLMSFLVMVSTMSITIEKHFCGDVLVDVALFSDVEKCGMEAMDMLLTDTTKKSCCKDTIDLVEGQDQLKMTTVEDYDIDTYQFASVSTLFSVDLFEGLPELVIPFKDYSPPNIITDISLLNEVFLI